MIFSWKNLQISEKHCIFVANFQEIRSICALQKLWPLDYQGLEIPHRHP